ncbi:MAG: urease accessory UreF family protein [Actinomycetota bacterium]
MGPLALLLADGRLPTGAHAHSGGAGWAIGERLVTDEVDLERWCRERLRTVGAVDAAATVWVRCRWPDVDLVQVDAELSARAAGPGAMSTSRRLGRGWRRLADAVAPGALDGLPKDAHRVVVLGALAAVLDMAADEVAAVVIHDLVAEACTAAVRLLGLDPQQVTAVQVRLADAQRAVIADAIGAAAGSIADLPCPTSPLVELAIEGGVVAPERLFAS